MKDIVGSGGFAKEVAFLVDEVNRITPKWNLLGFIDNVIKENEKYSVNNNDHCCQNSTDNLNVVFGIGEPLLIEKHTFS